MQSAVVVLVEFDVLKIPPMLNPGWHVRFVVAKHTDHARQHATTASPKVDFMALP